MPDLEAVDDPIADGGERGDQLLVFVEKWGDRARARRLEPSAELDLLDDPRERVEHGPAAGDAEIVDRAEAEAADQRDEITGVGLCPLVADRLVAALDHGEQQTEPDSRSSDDPLMIL